MPLHKLLFLTPSPIESASERYRIYQFLPYLERAGYACTVQPFATRALHRAIQADRVGPKLLYAPICYLRRVLELAATSRYDAVVIHRGIFPFPWPFLERRIIQRCAKVIFDFDDAIHIGHRNIGAVRYSWAYKLKYGPAVNEMLKACTHIIAGNRTLAAHALQFNSWVSIVPTVVDLERYTYRTPPTTTGVLTIGWVGSRSTSPYLLEIERALRRLSEANSGKIRFRFYGDPLRDLKLPNCESLPFSLSSEIEDLRTIDIGIMPLPDNDWTRGKCAFKAIQYMALGIPVVTSPVGTAMEVVQDRSNGFCARTSEDWFESLNRLVNDTELRRRFSEEGRKTVEARYSLQVWAPQLVNLLDGVMAGSIPAVHRLTARAAG